MLQPFAILCY